MKKLDFSSVCVREFPDNIKTKPHQLPIYATSSFHFESIGDAVDIFNGTETGHVYSRYGNPTVDVVATKLAYLEAFGTGLEAYGYLTSSGMSAIYTVVQALLKTGDRILTQGNLYGGTTELFLKVFGRQGIDCIFENFSNLDKVEEILKANPIIKLIYVETPANPTLDCIDLETISTLAKKYGVLTVVDNTFCTPYIQQPLAHGIDFVIHSTTKYLNGHGNSIAGVIISANPDFKKAIFSVLKLAGTNCNPFDAWLINNGLKTLALRMERHSSNALALAQVLESHPKIQRVNYNGLPSNPFHQIAKKQMKLFGGMISFALDASEKETLQFIDRLQLATNAPTLGDVDTLVLHPATSSHLNVDKDICMQYGITPNLIRMSIGIEDPQNIIDDVLNALEG